MKHLLYVGMLGASLLSGSAAHAELTRYQALPENERQDLVKAREFLTPEQGERYDGLLLAAAPLTPSQAQEVEDLKQQGLKSLGRYAALRTAPNPPIPTDPNPTHSLEQWNLLALLQKNRMAAARLAPLLFLSSPRKSTSSRSDAYSGYVSFMSYREAIDRETPWGMEPLVPLRVSTSPNFSERNAEIIAQNQQIIAQNEQIINLLKQLAATVCACAKAFNSREIVMADTNENSVHEAFLDTLDDDTRRVVAYFIDGEITALGYPSTRNGSKVFEQAQETALDTIINRELDLGELSSDILASIDAEGDNDEQRAVQKDTRKRIDSIAAYLALQTEARAG